MKLQNSYRLPNGEERISYDDMEQAVSDFSFFAKNYQQIVNKQRLTVPFELNQFQKRFFSKLLPMVKPETRLNRRHSVVVVKPRQVGASTGLTSFNNHLCSLVEGMNHLNIFHVFPVSGTINQYYTQKVLPIVTGVHPDLFPNIDKKAEDRSSITLTYKDIRTIQRDNTYTFISSNAQSIRSSTAHMIIYDECSFYRDPEGLEDAISPTLPDYGFSLVVYLSTFDDRKSQFFFNKIETALANPEDYTLIFTPWYDIYPEVRIGKPLNHSELTDYDIKVILPNLAKDHVPKEYWGDCIDWYHRKSLDTSKMLNEYPTTIEEVLQNGRDEFVFSRDIIDKCRSTILEGRSYTLSKSVMTGEVEAHACDESPLRIFIPPMRGKKYMIVVDPILSSDEKADDFAASVYEQSRHEQVATLLGNGLPVEDWAEILVSLAKLYNNAIICPETNLAQSIYLLIWAKGYYNWYYQSKKDRANRNPGIRTTATTKERMINDLILALKNGSIIIHDEQWVEEMEHFIKKRRRGSSRDSYTMEAQSGHKDDAIATMWVYAGTLDHNGIIGRSTSGWAVL